MNVISIYILLNIGAVLGTCPDDEVTQLPQVQTTVINHPKPSATRLYLRTDQASESTEHTNSRYSYTDDIRHTSQQYKESSADPYPKFASTIEPSTTHTIQATATPLITTTTPNTSVNAPPECLVLEDCKAWYDLGVKYSGIYTVNPDNGEPFKVYCDMETDGGGWTVFQRRIDGSVDFYRGWSDYESGFGNLTGEFWLGLTKIHRLTASGNSKQLRIDLGDFQNNYRYAKYSYFLVGDSTTKYKLNISDEYSGDAGDSLSGHNGLKFTTKDQDNDVLSDGNCAIHYDGAWWYGACHASNLNGLYLSGYHYWSYADGVEWQAWTGHYYSLRFTEMKLI